MPVELRVLVWLVVLALVQAVIAVLAARRQVGLTLLVGNRHEMPALTGLALRATRAHLNLLENLALFAIAVFVANAADRFNSATAFGAILFFWSRVAYAGVYLVGIPWLRTIVWAVSVAGIFLVLAPLF